MIFYTDLKFKIIESFRFYEPAFNKNIPTSSNIANNIYNNSKSIVNILCRYLSARINYDNDSVF